MIPENVINAMSVDVEDYFQVSAFEKSVSRADWGSITHRVANNTNRILDRFAENDVKATFFMLGWVAERYPELLKRIVSEGHELASHGYEHIRATEQAPKEFREDVTKTKMLLEDLSGEEVKGYRAASYSIGAKNLWAIDELAEVGYIYSSSIYPIKHDLYGMPNAPRFAFRHEKSRLGSDNREKTSGDLAGNRISPAHRPPRNGPRLFHGIPPHRQRNPLAQRHRASRGGQQRNRLVAVDRRHRIHPSRR